MRWYLAMTEDTSNKSIIINRSQNTKARTKYEQIVQHKATKHRFVLDTNPSTIIV